MGPREIKYVVRKCMRTRQGYMEGKERRRSVMLVRESNLKIKLGSLKSFSSYDAGVHILKWSFKLPHSLVFFY